MKYDYTRQEYQIPRKEFQGIRNQIFRVVGEEWYHENRRRLDANVRINQKIRELYFDLGVREKPQMIPVLLIKIKAFIREYEPCFLDRLIK